MSLTQKIMTAEKVAEVFGKQKRWVTQQVADGKLVPHYAGETMLFCEDEVFDAWKSGKLDKRRGNHEPIKRKRTDPAGSGWGPQLLRGI